MLYVYRVGLDLDCWSIDYRLFKLLYMSNHIFSPQTQVNSNMVSVGLGDYPAKMEISSPIKFFVLLDSVK